MDEDEDKPSDQPDGKLQEVTSTNPVGPWTTMDHQPPTAYSVSPALPPQNDTPFGNPMNDDQQNAFPSTASNCV